MADAGQRKYNALISNTMLFAISNFSSKLLSVIIQPYLSYALGDTAVMGVTKLTSQCANLLIPIVSLGMSFAIIRFGLDKAVNKVQVFTNGLATILLGFVLLLFAAPLMHIIPAMADYLFLIYVYVLVSCLRTLCTQFIRSRMYNRLVAIDGILCTFSTLMFYILFLNVLKLGATGYLLAIICGDGLSAVFVFLTGRLWNYLDVRQFNKTLWQDMLRYCVPMIPAQISFWIINTSDLFYVNLMCDGYGGLSGASWAGLLSTGYFLPTLVNTVGQIFNEAWQLSAVTEESEREIFFSKVFAMYSGIMFCCAAGIIWLCQPLMHIFKSNFYDAWQFVPLLAIAASFTCLNTFLNSVYVVYKRSTLSLYTMLVGAVCNLILNYALILIMGPVGAALASMLSLGIVLALRMRSTQGLLLMDFGLRRVGVSLAVLLMEATWLLTGRPAPLIIGLLSTAVVFLVNLDAVWDMVWMLLDRFAPGLARRLPHQLRIRPGKK